jgi:hypothetical protein
MARSEPSGRVLPMSPFEIVIVASLLLVIVSIGGSALIWAAIADGRS